MLAVRGGQNTQPDPKKFEFGLLLKPKRVKNCKPDRIVIGSGFTQPDPNTRSGRKKKKNSLNLNTLHTHAP